MSNDTVYADWNRLRLVVPVVLGLIVVGLAIAAAAFVMVSRAGSSGDPLNGQPLGEEAGDPDDPQSLAEGVLEAFVVALEEGRPGTIDYAFTDPATAAEQYATLTAELGAFRVDVQAGPVTIVDPANASAEIEAVWTLDDGTVFTTTGEADLALLATNWLVDWEPAILERSLDPGDALVRQRVVAPRAPILGRDGTALVDNRPVFDVGVVPREAGEIGPLSESLGPLLGRDPAEIRELIAPSPSDATVVVTTIEAGQLAEIEPALTAIPGVVLEPSTFPLPPDERFARALLGRAAEVTREIIDEDPDRFEVGDVAGRSGLQREYNARLAGVPGFEIRVRRRFPTTAPLATSTTIAPAGRSTSGPDPSGEVTSPGSTSAADAAGPPADPDVIYRQDPVPGTPLQLTIDPRVQRAAEDALARTELTSALVAVQPSTGEVLAVANGPGVAVNDYALVGQYPPGSVFKTVTAYAALTKGVGPDDPVDCPATLEVNGRTFSNAEGEVLGTVPVRVAYVLSCNTAFINLAQVLDPSDFAATAARFGIGVGYDLGTASYSGSVPTPGGPVEEAATAFGQGRVLFSPLSAAVLAATAASGTYRPPSLVVEPDRTVPEGQPLDQGPAATLQEFMRQVVTNGTGRAVNGVAGGPVSGKTGTAEFGDRDPPEAHAWFVGWQNDLAFAVFVEGGEFGGTTAAPIAADFLNRLAG